MEFTADKARTNQRQTHRYQIELCERRIKDACEDGDTSCVIDVWAFENEHSDDMLDSVYNELKDSGYTVSWNRACQWYEISW